MAVVFVEVLIGWFARECLELGLSASDPMDFELYVG